MAAGAMVGNTDVVSSGLRHLERLKSREDFDGDSFYDSDDGSSSKAHSPRQKSRHDADGGSFYDSDDGRSVADARHNVERAARGYVAANQDASVLTSSITSCVPSVRLSDPGAIWNTFAGLHGQHRRRGDSLIDVRRAQNQRMLIKTASGVRKLSESLENINDVLYHTGKRRAQILPLDSSMITIFGAGAAQKTTRLVLPPTLADDSLHVARLFRFIMTGEKGTPKSFVTHLRAFHNMHKTNMVLRTDRTPKSPRSGEQPVSVRSLDTTRNELYVLLGVYECNVLLIINRTGKPKIETLRFVHMDNNWIVLYVNKDNHIEIICETLEDDVIRVVFSPENPVFADMLKQLRFDPKRPSNIFSTKLLLPD
ncbi:hypothetical protein JKP88DRAFT_285311 [Tribonema minus]|uniref:Uncharacterized protein n=1 Tax=Tribonema minus TaxID=303371 RepID=A0A836CM01_9STRA|nr:hypothetical protein JKP88DRAFT_285311 [Tribonema minus]